jgi:Lon protease-like protein
MDLSPGAVLTVGLFPLPGVVLLPGVPFPLHIFEARYRALVEDALAGDRRFVLAIPAADAAPLSTGLPALMPLGTLVRIAVDERLPDGRFRLLAMGEARIRIVDETGVDEPYRRARVQVLEERPPRPGDPVWAHMEGQLRAAARLLAPGLPAEPPASDLPWDALMAVVSEWADLSEARRYALLADGDAVHRAALLLDYLRPLEDRLQRSKALRALYSKGWTEKYEAN